MPVVRNPDPFNAVLLSSPPLNVTQEQRDLVKKVLDKACSDSRFADKAYAAIVRIMVGQTTRAPVVSSLTPNSAEIGDPSFLLHVHGTNFTNQSKIVFNGGEEVTTFVGPTELTTTVDMSTAVTPVAVPVAVLNADGIQSDPMNFTFTDGTPAALVGKASAKVPDVKTPDVVKTDVPVMTLADTPAVVEKK